MICDNIKIILERIEKAKNKVGLKKDIKLVAVTKTVSIDKIFSRTAPYRWYRLQS